MSDKTISTPSGIAVFPGIYPVLRYAFGATIIITAAMALNYTLAYLTPVLAIGFLVPGSKAPTLKSSVLFLLIILSSCFSGFIFSRLFLNYPLVFIPLLILIIFHVYYTTRFQQMKVWFVISLLVIPMVSMQTPQLGKMVAVNLFLNAMIAMVLVGLVYFLFPGDPANETVKKKSVAALTPGQRFITAGKQIIVITPLLVLFFVFNWTGALLVLIFVTLLSMSPAASSKKAGVALIVANLGGGLFAIVAFNLLTVVPELIFLSLLTLFTGLLFGAVLFSKSPFAPLSGTAFSTFLLVLGNVTSFTGEAGEMVWSRIFQLGIVVVYVVVAFYVVNHFIPSEKNKN